MTEKDTGNNIPQVMYELATQPIFIDRSSEKEQEISWEVPSIEEISLPDDTSIIREEKSHPGEENTEIPEEKELIEEVSTEEETEKKKKKNRTSEKNRIAQLTRELRQAQSVTHDVLTRNQYLESKITQKEKESFTTQENYLTSQKERVKKYLTDALEEGDPSKIAEANDLLGQYNAEILMLSKQKQNIQETSSPPPSYNQHSYETSVDSDYQEVGNEWMQKNTWANPESPHFDKEMYEEADNYSIKLSRKYKLEGRGDEIGTSDFFDDITDYIKSSYDVHPPVSYKQPSREKMQMKTDKSPHVVPVSRQGMQGETSVKSRDMMLTPEQKEIAYSLRGFIRDPKTGNKITDNRTLEEIYKRNLMKGNG